MKRNTILVLCLIAIAMITLSSCGEKGPLTDADFKALRAGMTTKEIVNRLGEPKEIVTDNDLAHQQRQEDAGYMTDIWHGEDPEIYNRFAGSKTKLRELEETIENSTNLIFYHYEYGEDDYQNIYFIDGKVVDMTFK